ncbi:hypothetical protein PVAND_013711 [Polypedilum vanderplanki]|uniref:Uncharacterized protein n=1 Tax=Polypedilum vanderplanki TaxID=319348 RepID=A0A9J6CRJ2_POLVA|nr:hypothetical protein PVAND_013711 [Polypedilum vanderplanki]
MTWKITCSDCVLSETNRTNDNPVAIVNSAPKIRYTEAPTTSYLNESKQNGNISSGLNLTSRFKEITAKVVEDVNKTMNEFFTVCELTENPLETAIKRKANLGICVNVAAINALNIEIFNNLMPGDKIDIQNKRDETIAVKINQQEGIIENEPLVTEESQGVQENPENEHQENLDVLPKEATNCNKIQQKL